MIGIIKEHKGFGKMILKLAKSDLIKTYRGSALGWWWAIIKPSVSIFVYWFTFSVGFNITREINGYSYFLWLVAGLFPWFFMSEMIVQGTAALRKYRHLITKMNFPVSTIPTFVGLSRMYVHLGLLAIVVIIFAFSGHVPDIYYLQIPFYVLMIYLFFTTWTILASPLGAVSKDFINLISSFVMAIFYLSGIIWDSSTVVARWPRLILRLNPVTYLVNGYRDIFIYKQWFFEKRETLYFLVVLTLLMILASYVYRKLRKELPDVL